MQRLCTVLVLLGTVGVAHGVNCTERFPNNLTTCSAFNGVPASGTAQQMARVNGMQDTVVTGYSSDTSLIKSESCMKIYYAANCLAYMVGSVADPGTPAEAYFNAVPCSRQGQVLKMCLDWCYEYADTCYSGQYRLSFREACKTSSAPAGQSCFGNDGVLGMKPGSSASTSRPSARWVALPLAVAAVRLGGVF